MPDPKFEVGEIVRCISENCPAERTEVIYRGLVPAGTPIRVLSNGQWVPGSAPRDTWVYQLSHINDPNGGVPETKLRKIPPKPEAGSWDWFEDTFGWSPARQPEEVA